METETRHLERFAGSERARPPGATLHFPGERLPGGPHPTGRGARLSARSLQSRSTQEHPALANAVPLEVAGASSERCCRSREELLIEIPDVC